MAILASPGAISLSHQNKPFHHSTIPSQTPNLHGNYHIPMAPHTLNPFQTQLPTNHHTCVAPANLPRSPRLPRSLQITPLRRKIPLPPQRHLPALRRTPTPLPPNALLPHLALPLPRRRTRRQRPQPRRHALPHRQRRYLQAQTNRLRHRRLSTGGCGQGEGVCVGDVAG